MRRRCKPPVTITPYLIEAVRQASQRETKAEIAIRLGVAQATVSRIQRRHGIPHFDRSSGQRFVNDRRKQSQRAAVARIVAKIDSLRERHL